MSSESPSSALPTEAPAGCNNPSLGKLFMQFLAGQVTDKNQQGSAMMHVESDRCKACEDFLWRNNPEFRELVHGMRKEARRIEEEKRGDDNQE